MNLHITETAKKKVIEAMAEITEFRPIACIGWVSGGEEMRCGSRDVGYMRSIRPHWGLGFYNPGNLSSEEITIVSGIEFLRDEKLDGKTLDFHDGYFDIL